MSITMFVEKYMTADPYTIAPQTAISAVALEMSRRKIRHLLVAEVKASGKNLVGMVSKYDIGRAFPTNFNPFSIEVNEKSVPQPISSIMSRKLITVESNCSIEEAARILRARRINALPVLRTGHLAGIITESDIFAALLTMTGANVPDCKLVIESTDLHGTLKSLMQLSEQHHLRIHNLIASHDNELPDKVVSAIHFASRPDQRFIQELIRQGFRLLSVD